MGGDAFDKTLGIKRLTNEEFVKQTDQISKLIEPYCIRFEYYIPMPEKDSHGDIDFLVILKQNYNLLNISQAIGSQQTISNKQTINCIYNKHQVDFKKCTNDQEFEIIKFYKACSGIGYILGFLTHKCNVKLSQNGLYAVYKINIPSCGKLQYLLTNDVRTICDIYGVIYEDYLKGFKTKQELMRFLVSSKYFDLHRVLNINPKQTNKLWIAFKQYCEINQKYLLQVTNQVPSDLFEQFLIRFDKLKCHQQTISKIKQQHQRKIMIQSKFNGSHIQKLFGLKRQQIGQAKKKFQESFQNKLQYQNFLIQNQSEYIIQIFKKRVIEG